MLQECASDSTKKRSCDSITPDPEIIAGKRRLVLAMFDAMAREHELMAEKHSQALNELRLLGIEKIASKYLGDASDSQKAWVAATLRGKAISTISSIKCSGATQVKIEIA
jgi:hypothetical protein